MATKRKAEPLVQTGELGNSLAGKLVSLNTKHQTYFGVGTIWLSPENYKATIPDDLTDQEYSILQVNLDTGVLIEGDVQVDPVERDPLVLEKYERLIRTMSIGPNSIRPESVEEFRKLVCRRAEGGWTTKEILQHCADIAKKSGLKDSVLSLIRGMQKAAYKSEETFGIKRSNSEGRRSRDTIERNSVV